MWHAGVRGGSVVLEAVLPPHDGPTPDVLSLLPAIVARAGGARMGRRRIPQGRRMGHPRLQPG